MLTLISKEVILTIIWYWIKRHSFPTNLALYFDLIDLQKSVASYQPKANQLPQTVLLQKTCGYIGKDGLVHYKQEFICTF